MIQIKDNEITSTEGRIIHRLGTDIYFRTATTIKGDTADMFEEVDEIPPYTKAERDAKIAQMVRDRYTASEESGIQRKMLNLMLNPQLLDEEGDSGDAMRYMEEFNAYNQFVEQCKAEAHDALLADIQKRREKELGNGLDIDY